MTARNIIPIALFLALAEALALGAGSALLSRPAAAQFWGDPFSQPRPPRAVPQQQPFNPFGGIFQQPIWEAPRAAPRAPRAAPQPPRVQLGDFSKAPPPRKSDTPATTHIVVMGDSLADWLGHGLEEAYADNPEFGVVRKFRANTGLIRNESRSDSYDWVTSARERLAEKPDFIVMTIGLSDRVPIRERAAARVPVRPGEPAQSAAQPQSAQQSQPAQQAQQGNQQNAEGPTKPDQPAEPSSSGNAMHEFRSEKWGELYGKRIDDMIAALKSNGVPVIWVGLPPIRGQRARTDLAYLNDLYRARAQKAGITYVDVWDGFVDEDGNFSFRGPDYNGQIRQLRSPDGVYFTKAGALKLGHYVEREIERLMVARGTPVTVPAPEPQQQPPAKSGPAARPIAGPVIPLIGAKTGSEELAGAEPARSPDPVATRVFMRGEVAPPASGRADDFSWPLTEREDSNIIPVIAPPAAPPTIQRPTKKGPAPPTKAAPKQPGQAASNPPIPARQTR